MKRIIEVDVFDHKEYCAYRVKCCQFLVESLGDMHCTLYPMTLNTNRYGSIMKNDVCKDKEIIK